LRIKKTKLKLYPELGESRMIGYEGMIPGPTIKVEKGREIVLRVINEGGNSSVVHLHGSHTRAAFDGFANDLIPDGYFKVRGGIFSWCPFYVVD
jgi:bilirubin oxidase